MPHGAGISVGHRSGLVLVGGRLEVATVSLACPLRGDDDVSEARLGADDLLVLNARLDDQPVGVMHGARLRFGSVDQTIRLVARDDRDDAEPVALERGCGQGLVGL